MRASTARLMNSPVRLADLTFPQVNRLIHRTRLGFIPLDPSNPSMVFPALQQEKTSGVLELISDGRVSYLRFTEGRFVGGYYCDKPDAQSVGKFLEAQFQPGAAGAPPAISAVVFPPASDLPQQAPNALINTYRELYWRIVDEVEKEFPGEA